jgi:3-deoxy-D-manno-octulosonic-acid transferase
MLKKLTIEFSRTLYHIGIGLFDFAFRIYAAFSGKAAKILTGRRNQKADLQQMFVADERPVLFHCASVGEFEQAVPVIQWMIEKHSLPFLVSFYSSSGYEYAARLFPDWKRCYLPADRVTNVGEFLETIQPRCVLVIKYEFWLNFLFELQDRKIPVLLISGIFRPEQIFFRLYGGLFRKALLGFSHLFVQDQRSVDLLQKLGAKSVSLAGDTRLDRVLALSKAPFQNVILEQFINAQPLFIAGSVWPQDVEVIQSILVHLPKNFKVLIVPHEPSHFDAGWIQEPWVKYSAFVDGGERVMLLDQMGMLSRLYRFGHFAYIGGGFGRGLHNTLEPVIYRMPVVIGPSFQKFQEAVYFVEQGIAFSVNGPEKIEEILPKCVDFGDERKAILAKIDHFIQSGTNVMAKMEVFLNGYLQVKSEDK